MNSLGRHIVVEFYGCTPEILDDVVKIETEMVAAAKNAGATVINSTFHHFSPIGTSGVVVIQESHLAIHTWPEYGFASLDIFTCGDEVNPWLCYKHLLNAFQADHGSAMEMGRGQLELLEKVTEQYEAADSTEATLPHPKFTRNVWYTERDETVAMSLRHKGDYLYKQKSPYQTVEVLDTYAYGKTLTLDGKVMTTEGDEYVYHEMITHIPLFAHPNPKRVLIVGGGDGGAAREVVRHPEVEHVDLVEIDELVLEASKIHLPAIAQGLEHPKVKVHIADGIQFVQQTTKAQYDLVIIDSTDPDGPATGLFSETFYQKVYDILRPEGILVTQSESPRFNTGVFQDIYRCYRGIFGEHNVWCYLINVPTYPSGTWSLSFCAKGGTQPTDALRNLDTRLSQLAGNFHYFNRGICQAAFALPNYVLDLLGNPENQQP